MPETAHAMKQRHKKELAELKKAPLKKGEKKKARKEQLAKLASAQQAELDALRNGTQAPSSNSVDESKNTNTESTPEPRALTKAQKKKARRLQKEQEQKELRAKYLAEFSETGRDGKLEELKVLNTALESLNLTVSEVQADGNCLYHALADQLERVRHPSLETLSKPVFGALRKMAAAHMRQNADDYTAFATDADGEPVADFDAYCTDVADTSGKLWGGDVEIKALSEALQRGIVVHTTQASPLSFAPDGVSELPVLRITFHNHYYGSGAHYNSTKPL